MRGQTKGITEGIIWKEMLLYFFPVFVGSLFQQCYNLVDAVIIGQFAGKTALGAIDSTYGFVRLLLNFAIGITSGATVIVAQNYGAKNIDKMRKACHTIVVFMAVSGGIIGIVGFCATPQICIWMNVPEDIMNYAIEYTRIYLSGAIFMLVYNAGAAIMKAVGDSKTPLNYLTICCIINIILDLIFVAVLRWNVEGAALATVIAQMISAYLIMRRLFMVQDIWKLNSREMKMNGELLMEILKTGIPIALQSALFSISNIFMQSGINAYGTDAVAGWSVNGKLDFILWSVVDSLTITATTFVAQNYGARKMRRVREATRVSMVISMILVGMLSMILYFLTPYLSHLFISDQKIINQASEMMRWVAPFYVTCLGGEILSANIRGTGETIMPMTLILLGTCLTRIFWILVVLQWKPDLHTVIGGYPFSWIITSIMMVVYYYFVRKKWKRKEKEEINVA